MTYSYSALLDDTRLLQFHADSDEEAQGIAAKFDRGVISLKRLLPIVDWTKPVFSIEEAAAYHGCSTSHIYALVKSKQLPFSKPLDKGFFFRRESLEKLMELTETLPDAMRDKGPRVLKFKPDAA